MAGMDNHDGPADSQADTLTRVAALIQAATRHANRAAGRDLFSPWLDVVAETVTAAGYLADVPPTSNEVQPPTPRALLSDEQRARQSLQAAADVLDAATGPRDYRAVMVRAALTDALAITRRIRS